MPGHLFVIDGDITRLKCDAWLLPSDQAWQVTPTFCGAVGMEEEGQYRLRPTNGWPANGMYLHEDADPSPPDIWLGDIGRGPDEDPQHYAERAKVFAKVACQRIREVRRDELEQQTRRPLIALNVLGSGRGGKRSRRGQLLNSLIPALLEITMDEVDVALVCFGPVMHSAVQATRKRFVSDSTFWFDELGDGLIAKATDVGALARNNQLVLFLGAGISVDSGIPAWQHLLNGVAAEAGLSEREIEELARFDPRDQGTILERRLGGGLAKEVQRRMAVEKYSLIHGLLASLPVSETVTTNFDQLFETACRASGRQLAVLPGDEARVGERWLLKLHGDVGKSIVFTRADYLGAMATHSALRGIVQAMLMTRHMLFVGYSLRDEDFHQLVHEVRFARDDSSSRFGTAMVLEQNDLTSALWPEIDFVSTSSGADVGEVRDRGSIYKAARRLWIFFDLVGMLASSEVAYLTDDSFSELKSEEEAQLSFIVSELERFVANSEAKWPELQQFLDRFQLHDG